MKYLLENAIFGAIGEQKFKSAIEWRNGVIISDEPETLGGKDLGPDPYTLLLSSLVACTLATLRMYIDYKMLEIKQITVRANMGQKIIPISGEKVTLIERTIDFENDGLAPEIIQRLLKVADSCPISTLLKGEISVTTTIT